MAALFWTAVGALLYVTVGYPLLLRLLVWIRGPRAVRRGDALPRVSLVISAYNEAGAIAEKLRNALALDYPRPLLQIVVVSDASEDGTDEIVRTFAGEGVTLFRQPARRGKTAGLNAVAPALDGEIVVFSDANAMYQPDALRMLVRNFADPEVGCVTGEARYLEHAATAAEAGEMAYWNYEITLKRLESALGSMVGGDGAIYAIRRQLWRALPEDAINDFLNPLQIVAAGWRGVYEPAAICYEEVAGTVRREYRRRVRIVSRSWRAIFQEPAVLNPVRVGLFSLSVVSHKVLRWLAGLLLLVAIVSGAVAIGGIDGRLMALVVAAVATGLVFRPVRRLVSYGIYFVTISVASVVGILYGSVGRVSATWTPPRADVRTAGGFPAGRAVAAIFCIWAGTLVAVSFWADHTPALEALFWASSGMLAYVYLGYPMLMGAARQFSSRAIEQQPIEPPVTLLITANDEERVIEAKLRNSLQIDYPADRLRIVVASDGSLDRTNAMVGSFAGDGVVLLAFPERRGKIAAINDAMAEIVDDIVVFSDANTFLAPGAIRALVRNFADPRVGAVSGDVVLVGERAALGRSEDLYYWYERWLQQLESDVGSMIGVDGALYAIRRALFVRPPVDTILDDMAIPMAVIRAGRRVVFDADALAHERGSDTAREEFARKSRVIAGAVQFLRRPDSAVPIHNVQVALALLSHKALRWLSPLFAMSAFAAAAALAPASSAFALFAALEGVSLLLAIAGCYRPVRRWMPIAIAHYFWLVQAAAAVGLVRGLRGRQAVAWRRFQRVPMEVA